MKKRIINGQIVLEDRILNGCDLVIENDTIIDICPKETTYAESMEIIDAYGGYVMPGFIDVHSDYIEKMVAPRKTSVMDMELAVYEFEKECCSHGITTMFHSVSMLEGELSTPMRLPENVSKLADIIEKSHSQLHLIHHRFHMRFELNNLGQYDLMKSYLNRGLVHLISFMDHTPGQGQYRDLEVYKTAYLRKEGVSEQEMDEEISRLQNQQKLTLDKIQEACAIAKTRNIAIASHDDDTVEKLDLVKELGANISEFPITMEVAHAAKKRGMYTVVGAPNILLGGSHSGNLSARKAIEENCADILCSDYYPSALLHSIFQMVNYGQKLEDMVAKVTINPARATHIDHITGSIVKGKKADLLIVGILPNELPAITHVFVDGKLIQTNHYRV